MNVPYELHLYTGCTHGFLCAGFDTKFAESSGYVYEQLYHPIKGMSEEELKGYGELFVDLSRDMDYDAFAKISGSVTMMKLWMSGLHVIMGPCCSHRFPEWFSL